MASTGNLGEYDPAHPLESAYGLADPAAALAALVSAADDGTKRYGALDVKWGDEDQLP